MTGWQIIGWASIGAVVLLIDGLAASLVVILIRSAIRSTPAPPTTYRSRSHE